MFRSLVTAIGIDYVCKYTYMYSVNHDYLTSATSSATSA